MAEDLIEGGAAMAQLRRVGLSNDDGALPFKIFDQDIGMLRDVVGEDGRAPSGSHAGNFNEVLDGDRQPREPR